jgi:hypothetical protein
MPHAQAMRPPAARRLVTAPGAEVRARAAKASRDGVALGEELHDLHVHVRERLAERLDPPPRLAGELGRVELVDDVEAPRVHDLVDQAVDGRLERVRGRLVC